MRLTVAELRDCVGQDLGVSGWLTVDQQRVDAFAEATGDNQWIHVDLERARAGPFGQTIAHGYLLLSLIPKLLGETLEITDRRLAVNYGSDRIRFTSPVAVGSRVRLHTRIADAETRGEGVLAKLAVELQVDGADKPAFVGEILTLVFSSAGDPA